MIRAGLLGAFALGLAACGALDAGDEMEQMAEQGVGETSATEQTMTPDRITIDVLASGDLSIDGETVTTSQAMLRLQSFREDHPSGPIILLVEKDAETGDVMALRGAIEQSMPGTQISIMLPDDADGVTGTVDRDSANSEERMVQPEMDMLDRVQDTCGMSAVGGFLGDPVSAIPENRILETTRILAPGDQATMDYVPRRLNILVDEERTVIGFKCG